MICDFFIFGGVASKMLELNMTDEFIQKSLNLSILKKKEVLPSVVL